MPRPNCEIEIYLLGKPEVRRGGSPLPPLATCKSRSLFAYLVIHRACPHSRDQPAALFWGDRDETHAHHSLATALWGIRCLLGADHLLADSSSVQFNPGRPCWLDVDKFVIRFWWDLGDESSDRTRRWHARIEHVQSGDGRSFQEITQMLEFMRRFVTSLEMPAPTNMRSVDAEPAAREPK